MLRNCFSYLINVVKTWMVFRLQLDLEVGVLRADAVSLVEEQSPVDGQPDMIGHYIQLVRGNNLSYDSFHLIQQSLGLFQPNAGRHADVQPKLAGIYVWEKVFTNTTHQQQRGNNYDRYATQHEAAMIECGG